jgi:UDP-3-O-[3-hydroxymyristoyl] glucosamine N-acyltransferase
MNDLPAGGSYGGAPAIPSLEWHRQTIAISRLNKPKRGSDE